MLDLLQDLMDLLNLVTVCLEVLVILDLDHLILSKQHMEEVVVLMEVLGVYTITQEIPDLVVVEEEELIIEVGVLVDPVVIVAVLVQMVLTMAAEAAVVKVDQVVVEALLLVVMVDLEKLNLGLTQPFIHR